MMFGLLLTWLDLMLTSSYAFTAFLNGLYGKITKIRLLSNENTYFLYSLFIADQYFSGF